eukprot:2851300-Amphidinium_carterae.2
MELLAEKPQPSACGKPGNTPVSIPTSICTSFSNTLALPSQLELTEDQKTLVILKAADRATRKATETVDP